MILMKCDKCGYITKDNIENLSSVTLYDYYASSNGDEHFWNLCKKCMKEVIKFIGPNKKRR